MLINFFYVYLVVNVLRRVSKLTTPHLMQYRLAFFWFWFGSLIYCPLHGSIVTDKVLSSSL